MKKSKRRCEWCGELYFPTSPKQRFCCMDCSARSNEYRRRKANMENKTLEQMAEEANALGLSYGEYVRVMTTELQEWKRQKGGK